MSLSGPSRGQPPPQNQVGPYLVDSPLGGGAAAMVYRAHLIDEASRKASDHPDIVALKVLRPEAISQPKALACFQFEARVVSRLSHSGIMRVYDTGMHRGRMYTAMELIDGPSFDQYLLAKKRLVEAAAINVACQLSEALDYLHTEGYVHRDIKPANLMMTKSGVLKITDFGTAIRIADGAPYEVGLYGTPSFLAPEQIIEGGRIDGRSDLYAVGMILYLMVAGRRPFYGSRNEVLQATQEMEPPAPSSFSHVSPDLEAIVLKALAKDPDERYQTGSALAKALNEATLIPEPPVSSIGARLLGWMRGGR